MLQDSENELKEQLQCLESQINTISEEKDSESAIQNDLIRKLNQQIEGRLSRKLYCY